MEFDTQSDHPIVGAILWLGGFLTGFGLVNIFLQSAAFLYIVIWSLDRWGLYDIGLDDKLVLLEWVRWPIQQLEKFVANKQQSEVFTPADKA